MILFLDLRSNIVELKAIPLTQIGRKKFYRTAIIGNKDTFCQWGLLFISNSNHYEKLLFE